MVGKERRRLVKSEKNRKRKRKGERWEGHGKGTFLSLELH